MPNKNIWNVGLDIGIQNIKLVALQEKAEGYELMAHAIFNRSKISELKNALEHPQLRSGKFRVGIEESKLKKHKIVIPLTPPEELDEMIRWGLRNVLASNQEDSIIRYQALPASKEATDRPYITYILPSLALNEHLKLIKELGIPYPEIIEPSSNALLLSFRYALKESLSENIALLDCGAQDARFYVLSSEEFIYSKSLETLSGQSLTNDICESLGIETPNAERLKKEPLTLLGPEKEDLEQVKIQYLSKAAIEIQRALDLYSAQHEGDSISALYFSGGGSELKTLQKHIATTLNLNTFTFNPFQTIATTNFQMDSLQERAPFYAIATGLAL